jgi:hypothetical protein
MDTLPADVLTWVRTQVRKDGVGLGGLSWTQQRLALGWVWAGLPTGRTWTEPALNALLQAQLGVPHEQHERSASASPSQGAACWLRCDHVELRRWLVDAGLLTRDGYGRAYQRAEPEQWPDAWSAELRRVVMPFSELDTAAWVQAERAAYRAERARRQAAWLAQGQTA